MTYARKVVGTTTHNTEFQMFKPVLAVVTGAFGVLSFLALRDHGYWGIIAPHFTTFGLAQVFVDLVLACALAMVWIWRDARTTGRNPWIWLAVTLVSGSFGPLLYLLTRPSAAAVVYRAQVA
jgi:hypothetical protein